MKYPNAIAAAVAAALVLCLTGCVDQSPDSTAIDDSAQSVALAAAVQSADEPRIAATSVAVMQICEALDLDLVGVPSSSLVEIPERYASAVSLGSPMSPDLELLSQAAPDWVLSPSSLQSDLAPKYEAAGLRYAFLNLKSVKGMYKSISEMGELFGCEEKADELVGEFEAFYSAYCLEHEGKEAPTVLILMGLPGSYVVATPHSYVGSLVEMAGGINVYSENDEEFLNVNTEDMLDRNPDIILRTAHAMPESVMEMFAEEFETNDIWKHFRAVENGKVYDLSYETCGMSANFRYREALTTLDMIFYE